MTSIRLDQPELLWLLLLAAPIVWLGMRSLAQLDAYRRWTAIALRLAALLLIVLMLAGLQAVQRHTDLTVVAVMDRSESVRHFFQPPIERTEDGQRVTSRQWMRQYLAESASNQRGEDRFGMVAFDARPRVRVMPDTALTLDPGTIDPAPQRGTDIAAALRMGMALFPRDTGARMVLVSDGNDTASQGEGALGRGEGALIEAAREARAAGVAVDVLPLEYRVENEVMVENLHAPAEARRGQTVPVRIVLRATQPTRGTLHLLHDDQPRDIAGDGEGTGARIGHGDWTREDAAALDDEPDLDAGPGQYVAVKQLDLPLHRSGPARFEAIFEPDAGYDSVAVNNRAETFTQVVGEGQVLFVDNVGGESGAILPRALAGRGIELDLAEPAGLPTRLADLQRYDAVVLQNVPASMVTRPQRRMLARYVHDLGGGLVKVGGPESFGAGGWADTEIDRIMPVDSEIPQQTVMPSGALMVVIDRSGSMNAPVAGAGMTRQQVANEAAVLALKSLYPQDMVGVVSFTRTARWEVELQEVGRPAPIAEQIRNIRPGGGTHIYPGIVKAEQALAQLGPDDAAVKHVIVLTDGMDNPGLTNDYPGVAERLKEQGATLSTVGVGEAGEIDSNLLSRLADWGEGEFYHVTDPNELPEIFIKEAQTIRRTLIREQTFQPQRIVTGSPITGQIAGVPELHGFVLTHPKRDPRIYMPITGPEGEPIFAHWQVGLGRTAAFTSDATNRWASDWLGWAGYADFWTRTLRTIARPAQGRNLDLLTARRGDELRIRLDATDAETDDTAGFADFLTVRGSIITPDGQTRAITLEQTGPGVYETTTDADEPGNYMVNLIVQQPDGSRQTVFGGATRPPGEELRRFRSNTAVLEQIAEITGGRWLDPHDPAANPLFDRTGVPESRSVRPLWRTLLVMLLGLFMLDVASRRIAWDPVAIGRWTRQRTAQLAGALRPRRVEAEPTLAALKQRRTVVDARFAKNRADAGTDDAPQPAPVAAATRQRKFQADPAAKPQADVTAALGGAKPNHDAGASPQSTKTTEPAATGTTGRLRAAKQRARQNLQNDET